MLGQKGKIYTDGATVRFRQQAGKSAQGLSTNPGWGIGGRRQSGDGKRCDKERGTGQNFRVVLKFKNLSESLGGLLKCRCLSPTPRVCDSVGVEWGRAPEFAYPAGSQLM